MVENTIDIMEILFVGTKLDSSQTSSIVLPFFVILLVSTTEGSQNLIVIPLQYAFVYNRYT